MMTNNSGILRLFGVGIVVVNEPDDHDQKSGIEFCTAGTSSVFAVDYGSNTATSINSDSTIYSPTPLRLMIMPQPDDGLGKRKRGEVNGGGRNKRRMERGTKRGRKGKDSTTPLVPLEEIPELLKQVEDRNGARPVFLYGKELEESDVCNWENRLFVNKSEKFEELFSLADLERGKEVEGVDGRGNTYKLGLVIWNSLQKLVLKKEWRKLVEKNGAKMGDWVQVWSFRVGRNKKLVWPSNL